MLRTLACLAGAMTSTTVFLHWLDPSLASPMKTLHENEIKALSRSLVTDSIEIRRELWRQVAVVPDSVRGGDGIFLAASPDISLCHFYVDDSGLPSRARGWARQITSPDSPNTIRIQVARVRDASEFPADSQWLAIRGLVSALDAALARNVSLPIVILDDSKDNEDSARLASD